MSENNNLTESTHSILADDSGDTENGSSSRAAQETVSDFETADLTPVVEQAAMSAASSSPKTKKQVKQARSGSPLIVTSNEDSVDADEQFHWQQTYRGMPSWLTSLIFHLSIILILALVSVSDGGKKIVELLGTANERIEIEPYVSIDVALDPVEIDTLDEEIETPSSKLLESSELAPVLEEAVFSANLESEIENKLFESISSAGIEESDLPRRVNGGGAKFFGVDGEGSDFVFIVDCSGSMADYGRWSHAVRELKTSIEGLKNDQRFLILLYNDGFIAMNEDAKLVKSSKREQKKAFKWLSRNTPDSWTFCAQALEKALTLRPDAIFLLSDGEFNDRPDVFFVLDTLNGKNRLKRYERQQIPVHTVALGSHQGRFTMKRIADENSGIFKLVE